jgi:hypothetical protein
MRTSTQVYRELKAAQFSEPQAKTLVEILQAAGIIEPEPPETELDRLEQYLSAAPFQAFVIEMSTGTTYRIDRRDRCGFTRHGSVQLSGIDDGKWAILEFRPYHPSAEGVKLLSVFYMSSVICHMSWSSANDTTTNEINQAVCRDRLPFPAGILLIRRRGGRLIGDL